MKLLEEVRHIGASRLLAAADFNTRLPRFTRSDAKSQRPLAAAESDIQVLVDAPFGAKGGQGARRVGNALQQRASVLIGL